MHRELVSLRRRIHQHPEVGLSVPRTQEAVLSALRDLPLEVTTGTALTSVVAVLRGQRSDGHTVLLRADMDGLPGTEETGLDFASSDGTMHACGHDLHTSMLVGAARLLSNNRDRLAGDVVLMFQPGEEGAGGARHMIEEGVLDAAGRRADAAFALHVESSRLRNGIVACREGTLMAAADVLRVTVRGAGGHGSAPHLARDPIPATAEMVVALQAIVTRRFDVFDPVVITVGSLHAGTRYNIIPDQAYFEAAVRSFSRAAHKRVGELAMQVCRGIAAAHGLEIDVELVPFHSVTVNDAAEVRFLSDVVGQLLGPKRWEEMPFPLTAAEDFSRVLNTVPGAMAFLGACPPGADPAAAPFNHSAHAVFDDGVLSDGAAVLAQFALQRLASLSGKADP